jgi:hypothetical protein
VVVEFTIQLLLYVFSEKQPMTPAAFGSWECVPCVLPNPCRLSASVPIKPNREAEGFLIRKKQLNYKKEKDK